MNFAEVKAHLRALSGRYDLVDDDPNDTVSMLINQACHHLDRLTEHQKSAGSHFALLAAGNFHLLIPQCRAVKEVWAYKSDGERWQIYKMPLQDLITSYMSGTPTNGTTLYYSPVITRKIPKDADLSSFASYLAYLDTITTAATDLNGIAVIPPPDVDIVIEVRGLFYSSVLEENSDSNFWTVNHPLTLIKAALREIEIFNQNQSKVEGWDKALAIDIDQINKDLVSEQVAELGPMELKNEDFIR